MGYRLYDVEFKKLLRLCLFCCNDVRSIILFFSQFPIIVVWCLNVWQSCLQLPLSVVLRLSGLGESFSCRRPTTWGSCYRALPGRSMCSSWWKVALFSDILLEDDFVRLNFEDIFMRLSGRHKWLCLLSAVSCLSERPRWKSQFLLY